MTGALETITRRLAHAGVGLLILCAVLNSADIATRRTLQLSVVGMVDATQLLVMASAFLCIPLTFLREAQIEVDFVAARWTGRLGAALRCVTALGCGVFMGAVAVAAARATAQAWQHGDQSATLAIPLVWYWAPVVLGCALSALACLAVAVRHGQRAAAAGR